MKLKRKSPAFTLDFVTALALAECEARLNLWSTPQGRTLDASPDHPGEYVLSRRERINLYLRFDRGGGYYTVAQAVILRPVQDGTYVLGNLHPATLRRLRLEQWVWRAAMGFGLVILLLSLFQYNSSQAHDDNWGGFLGFLMLIAWFHLRQTSIHNRARDLSRQIHDMLYEAPPDAEAPGGMIK
jgi:hypothetical protein